MSTRFIRKRYRRVVPIGRARLRESHLLHGPHRHHRLRNYPLFETANTIYNFQNIKESMICWNEYSENLDSNLKNTVELLKLIGSHSDSTKQEINEVTRIICENVLPYIKNIEKYKKYLNSINESKLEEAKNKISDELYILSECDRINNNFNLLKEDFDVIDFFIQDLKIRPLSETLYRFCDIVSDQIPQYPDNFIITTEMSLYVLDKIMDNVPVREVSEGIIDYYLEHGLNEDMNAFAESLDICLQNDEFLPNEINDYMLYIQNVVNKEQIYQEAVDEYFDNNIDMQLIEEIGDPKQIARQRAYESLQEFQVFDRIKEIVTKFKTTPQKTVTTLKNTMNALFVTHRLEDIKKGTFNALSLIFYSVCVIACIPFGLLPTLLGFLISLNLQFGLNKEYYQEAIKAWTQHKYDVEKRLKNASNEDRSKLSKYLEEVEHNIKILKDKYETLRDDTSKEIEDKATTEYNNEKHDPTEPLMSPTGEDPLKRG